MNIYSKIYLGLALTFVSATQIQAMDQEKPEQNRLSDKINFFQSFQQGKDEKKPVQLSNSQIKPALGNFMKKKILAKKITFFQDFQQGKEVNEPVNVDYLSNQPKPILNKIANYLDCFSYIRFFRTSKNISNKLTEQESNLYRCKEQNLKNKQYYYIRTGQLEKADKVFWKLTFLPDTFRLEKEMKQLFQNQIKQAEKRRKDLLEAHYAPLRFNIHDYIKPVNAAINLNPNDYLVSNDNNNKDLEN